MKILKDVTKEIFGSEFKHLKSSFLGKGGEICVQGKLLLYFWFRTHTNIFTFSCLNISENFICFTKLSSPAAGLRSLKQCRDFSSGDAVVPMFKSHLINE